MNVRSATATILIGLLATSQTMAAKPPPPPPTPIPQPTPTSCTGATGVYPAVAYTKDRRHLKGRTSVYDGTDIYIGTSTGSCSSIVWSLPNLHFLTYRQVVIDGENEGRIVWIDYNAVVWLLKFHVENGNIVDPLPLSASLVYTPPTGSVNDVELSPDGQTIYFTDQVLTSDNRWLTTAKSIDISSCSSSCAPQTIYTFPLDNSAAGLSVNSTNDRIYMSIHDRVPNIRTISFLQKQDGIWSSLRHVVSNRDAAYATMNDSHTTDVGRWDFTKSGVLRDVLAYVVGASVRPHNRYHRRFELRRQRIAIVFRIAPEQPHQSSNCRNQSKLYLDASLVRPCAPSAHPNGRMDQ